MNKKHGSPLTDFRVFVGYRGEIVMSKKILCFGDSNTYGYNPRTGGRYPRDVRWTGILAEELGDSFEVIEEGCNGRTTVFEEPGAPWKAGKASIQVILNSHKPVDLVILMLGSNDLKNIYSATTSTIASGAELLVQMIRSFTLEKQEKPARILLVSPPVIGEGIASTSPFGIRNNGSFDETAITRSRQFAPYYRNIAERYGCLFADAAEHIRSSEIDSLHLDPDAHLTLGRVFADIVRNEFPAENASEKARKNQLNETSTSIARFRQIIARLRDPETGCRWDKAQTLDSVKACCIEEAAEVLAGIDLYNATGNSDNLKEELGDLLMQVVLQSQIAEELGLFDLNDVIQVISEKMIRRHPHVFHVNDPLNGELEEMIRANQARDENGQLLTSWAEIKALEKRGKVSADGYLPKALEEACAFLRAAELRKSGKK